MSTHAQTEPLSPSPLFRPGFLLAAFLTLVSSASAQLFWDTNAETPGAGGPSPTGDWDLSLPRWTTDPSGASATAPWVNGSTAVFSAGTDASGAYSINVGAAPIEVSGLTFQSGNVSLFGSPISLSADALLSVAAGRTASISNSLSGAALSFSGPGRLTLAAANTFTGPLAVSSGRLVLDHNFALGTADLQITPASAVYLQNSTVSATLTNAISLNLATSAFDISALAGTLSLHGPITGNQTLWTVGGQAANTVLFGGNNSFVGNLLLSGGTLIVARNNALGDDGGNTRVNAGTTLGFQGSIIYSTPENIKLNGSGVAGQGALLNVSGNNVFYGQVDLQSDVAIGAAAGTLELAGSVVGPPRNLVKTGPGTLVLSGFANDYLNTTVAQGTLEAKTTLGTGSVSVQPGAALSGVGDVAGPVTLAGTIAPGTGTESLATGPQSWQGGATYSWEINDADFGLAGDVVGWDLLQLSYGSGALDITATTDSKITIKIGSLNLSNLPGPAADFDNTDTYTFEILNAPGGITGFDPARFNLDTSAFQNPVANGAFVIQQSGNSLVLRFVQKPVIVTAPAPQTVNACGNVTFSVAASGTAPLAYQWFLDAAPLPGATATSLSLSNVSATNAGTYSVIVSNLSGLTATAATLLTVVDPPPVVATKPTTVNLNAAGEGATSVAQVWDEAATTDNCSPVEFVSLSQTNFTFCDVGLRSVIVSVRDTAGNIGTATANVAVLPPETVPTTMYVDPAYSGCTAVSFPKVGGTGTFYVGYNAFPSIQSALNAVPAGGTVRIAPGTYVENVVVTKSVSLLGPNAGIRGNDPARSAEAIVIPAINDPENTAIISLEASGVTIDGLLLDGHNSFFATGGYDANGVRVSAAAGIQNGVYPELIDIGSFTIQNNVIRNISYDGVYVELSLGLPNGGNYIRYNKFENMWEGLQTYALHSVIAENTFVSCNRGLSLHGTITPAPEGFSPSVSSNSFTIAQWWPTEIERTNAQAIWINYRRENAAPLDVVGNVIHTPAAVPAGYLVRGLYVLSVDGAGKVNFIDNTVNGAGNCQYGLTAAACWSNNAVSLRGGSFHGIRTAGVLARTVDPVYSDPADCFLTISNLAINLVAPATGILALQDLVTPTNAVTVTVSGLTTITGPGTGLAASGARAAVSFSGPAPATLSNLTSYLLLSGSGSSWSTNDVDATQVLFNGLTGPAMSQAELFATEDKIQHRIDNPNLGLVRVKAQNLYVLPDNGTIQRAVDIAADGETINVAPGTYVENVVVPKPLTILGPNAGIPAHAARGPEAIVMPQIDDPEAEPVFSVTHSFITIDGFLLDGNNPALNEGYDVHGVDVNAAAGVQNGSYPLLTDVDHLTVQNNIIRNVSYDGVYLQLSLGFPNGWNYIRHNTFDTMWEGLQTYAMHSVIAENLFTNCHWGLSLHGTTTAAPEGFTPLIASNRLTIAEWWTTDIDRTNAQGIWINYRRANAADLKVVGNVINTPAAAPAGCTIRGLYALTVDSNRRVEFIDNTVNGAGNCTHGFYAVACLNDGGVQLIGGSLNNLTEAGVLARTFDPVWYAATDAFLTVSNVQISTVPGGTGILALQPPSTPNSKAQVTVLGNTPIAATTAVKVAGPLAAAIVRNNPASLSATTVGIDVDAGKALLENNNLTGSSVAAIRLQNGAIVDAGNCTGSNLTGLGSSTGQNLLTGYGFDATVPWAIDNLGGQIVAYANLYGATANDNIASLISGTAGFSQAGGTLVKCLAPVTVECVAQMPAPATTLGQFLAQGGLASCSPATVTSIDTPANPTGNAVVTRAYTITDACGVSASCSQTITVQDAAPPVITAPAAISRNVPAGTCSFPASDLPLGTPGVSDNCAIATVTNNAPAQFPIGLTVVTWSAKDINGLESIATQSVTIVDAQPPLLTAPADLLLPTDADLCSAANVALGSPAASDNCTLAILTNNAPATFPKGTNLVTWTAVDSAGLVATATQLVVVEDRQDPALSVPPNVTIPNTDSIQPYALGLASGSDNCGPVSITFTDTADLTNCNATGIITRRWRVTDSAQRFTLGSQTITVADAVPPVFTFLPAAITTTNDPGRCSTRVTFPPPVAIDPAYTQSFENAAWFSFTNQSTLDWNNAFSQISRATNGTDAIPSKDGVAHAVIDSSPSVLGTNASGAFTGLGGSTAAFGKGFRTALDVYLDLNDPAIVAGTYGFSLSSKVCDPERNPFRSYTFHVSSDATRILVAADSTPTGSRRTDLANGNHYAVVASGWFTFEWIVRDNGSGVVAATCNLHDASGTVVWSETVSVSTDLVASTGGNGPLAFDFINPAKLAIDNSRLERFAAANTSVASGTVFPVGNTLVTCTATDACGNMTNTTFSVTVTDTDAPTVSCPDNIVRVNDPNLCGAVVNFSVAASDNCGLATTIAVPAAGTLFPIGTTTVNVTATDLNGNVSTCSFNVTVNDAQLPALACPTEIFRFVSAASDPVQFPLPAATDNCSVTVVALPASGTVFPVGTNLVNVTAWDPSLNTNTCAFNLVVFQGEPNPGVQLLAYTNHTSALAISGFTGAPIVLQASTNLIHWSALRTNAAPYVHVDTDAPANLKRFYRAAFVQ